MNDLTPPLSTSQEPSPAFSTILQSPNGSDTDIVGLGEPALGGKGDQCQKIPECWGHRGVSHLPYTVTTALIPLDTIGFSFLP
jgi:hypothetical protein